MSETPMYRKTRKVTERVRKRLGVWSEAPESDVTMDGDELVWHFRDGWPARDALPTTDPEDC